MNIGQAASASGVSAKMIRYYESKNLIKKAARSYAGYRFYTEQDLETLRFIGKARALGFSLNKISDLLKLWRNQTRPSAKVKAIATEHITELDQHIAELIAMRDYLKSIIDACPGSDDPHCPILNDMSKTQTAK